MTSADIKSRKWTEAEKRTVKRISQLQAQGDDKGINFDDIPRLTKAQLAAMVRLKARKPKVAVSVRLDPLVVDWLKSKGGGHLTRINDILSRLMEAERRINPVA